MCGKPERCTQQSQGYQNSLSEEDKESSTKRLRIYEGFWHGYGTKLNPLVHFQRLSTLKLMLEGRVKLLDVEGFGK